MRSVVFGFVASLLGSVLAEDSSEHVEVLTESSFDDFIAENKYVLAEFYAPWCGHCKALKPEYAKAAADLKSSNSTVRLAMIDATEEKDLAQKFDVRGYPTLMWFENGKKSEYDGGRTASEIVEWVNEASQPAVKDLASSSSAPSPSSRRPVVILSGPETARPVFTAFAEKSRSLGEFFFTPLSSSSSSTLSIQHKGETAISTTFPASPLEEAAISDFFESHAFPLFGELNGKTYSRYMDRSQGMLWLLPEVSASSSFEKAVDALRPKGVALAQKLPEYSVVYIDTVQFKGAVENMLGVSTFPAAALHLQAGDKKKFVFPGSGSVEELVAFVKKAESGEIQPTYKSEAVPEKNDGAVKTVVGSTLKETVFNKEGKDVMLAITATWCGHCKKLKPEYEKVAKKAAKEGLENVLMIANMDGTLNDSPVEEIAWQGFPTIFYVKGSTKEIIPYDGARDAKGIWKWIKNNHSQKDTIFANKPSSSGKTAEESAGKEEL